MTAVLPVASLILGAWLNQLSEGRREAAALAREEKIRQLDREQARIERRETFELTHLVEVNDLLMKLFNTALICHDLVGDSQPLGEANGEMQRCNRQITRAKGLVLDDVLRSLVDTAHAGSNRLCMDSSGDWRVQAEVFGHFQAAHEGIAERIRDIYRAQSGHLQGAPNT